MTDSKHWKEDFSKGPQFINPMRIMTMRRALGKFSIKNRVLDAGKNIISTSLFVPVIVAGAIYSTFAKDD
jgi:hypothetical protein